MKKMLLSLLVLLTLTASLLRANTVPTIQTFKFDDKALINSMSDNGLWAVANAANPANSIYGINPRLIDLSTNSIVLLTEGIDEASIVSASVSDVTDDGKIVVGEFNTLPGYWNRNTGKWVNLPLAKGATGGSVLAVTPDGKFAVGNCTYEGNPDPEFPYMETVALWDLKKGQLIPMKGLPTLDMANENKKQNRFISISADGNMVLGCMSISYWPSANYAGGKCYYAYNVKEQSYKIIGFLPKNPGTWTPLAEGITFISAATLSSHGEWVTGVADMVKKVEGAEFSPEYTTPYLYNTQSQTFSLLNETTDNGMLGVITTQEGTLVGAAPDNNPYREWYIRSGKYWVAIAQVLKQKYDFDFVAKSGFENTGTPLAISNDNRRIAVMADPENNYVITLPEDINTICNDINLLDNYTVSPMAGSELSKLQKITVRFDRNVEVLGNRNAVEIRNAEGQQVYASTAFKIGENDQMVNITYRSGALEAGQQYTLHIPAGTLCLKGDKSKMNQDIDIAYVGRANVPVKMLLATPENGATIAKIDAENNPVLLTFDANVQTLEGKKAQLFRAEENKPYCELLLAHAGKRVALYPTIPQQLFKGAEYRIVVPEGCITDVTGNNANNEITLNYVGAYEREVSSDDKVLFADHFDYGVNNFLLFEGDKHNPTEQMKAWDFQDGINFPWVPVRDDNSSDMAVASHSMYSPAGQSYDWMVIPQTFIPDRLCTLNFLSQSYLKSKKDYLKVIVWASDNAYQVLNKNIVDRMYKEGTVVYNQLQHPGNTEDLLEGEWTENSIDLQQFAGKNVYIAFLNENNNQSVVFLDNVEVLHNIPFLVTFDNATSVTAQQNIVIKGRITSDTDAETYTSATLTLKNAAGNVIDVIKANDLNLKKGDTYNFAFSQPMPLIVGKMNGFSVDVKLNNTENTIRSGVKNLSFEPVKRVVLEEFTGMTCVNCPLGILAIEKIKSLYGKQFLPIGIHAYMGDPLGTGLNAYSDYFGFSGAPSGMIQRSGSISSPMVSVEQDYRFNGVNGDKLWLDLVQEELSIPADAEISATAKISEDAKTVEVPCTVRYAMDTENLNVNLFIAFTEDGVVGFQQNNLMGIDDPDLGKFGKGGEYAKGTIYPYFHDHVARGWYGDTFAGTAGLIPTHVVAGKDYTTTIKANLPESIKDINKANMVIMMVDANTARLVNAVEIPVNGQISGIGENENDPMVIEYINGQILVNANGYAMVEVYDLAGQKWAQTDGHGIMKVSTNGYHGVAIVKVSTKGETVVKKIML